MNNEHRIPTGSVTSAIKGRGTALGIPGRFETLQRAVVDDGWHARRGRRRTRILILLRHTLVQLETARAIITRNHSPDIFFNLSINPYRGCEHGCIYCYARPNHGYVGLSPGLDFETRLFAKVNAPELFRKELAREGYQCEPINIGSVTDPYQPIERQYRITRQLLEVALTHRQPVTLITKGSLIERDIDLLSELSQLRLASVVVTITTLEGNSPESSSPGRVLRGDGWRQ